MWMRQLSTTATPTLNKLLLSRLAKIFCWFSIWTMKFAIQEMFLLFFLSVEYAPYSTQEKEWEGGMDGVSPLGDYNRTYCPRG